MRRRGLSGTVALVIILATVLALAILVFAWCLGLLAPLGYGTRPIMLGEAGDGAVNGPLIMIPVKNYGSGRVGIEAIYINRKYPLTVFYVSTPSGPKEIEATENGYIIWLDPGETVYIYGYVENMYFKPGVEYDVMLRTIEGYTIYLVYRPSSRLLRVFGLPIYLVCIDEELDGKRIGWHYIDPAILRKVIREIASLYTISTYRDLYLFIYKPDEFAKVHPGYPTERAVLVNCHGEVIPYAGPYDPSTDSNWWIKYLNDLRRALAERHLIFINIGGYFAWSLMGAVCGEDGTPIKFVSRIPSTDEEGMEGARVFFNDDSWYQWSEWDWIRYYFDRPYWRQEGAYTQPTEIMQKIAWQFGVKLYQNMNTFRGVSKSVACKPKYVFYESIKPREFPTTIVTRYDDFLVNETIYGYQGDKDYSRYWIPTGDPYVTKGYLVLDPGESIRATEIVDPSISFADWFMWDNLTVKFMLVEKNSKFIVRPSYDNYPDIKVVLSRDNVSIGSWHTLTLIHREEGDLHYFDIYIDGERVGSINGFDSSEDKYAAKIELAVRDGRVYVDYVYATLRVEEPKASDGEPWTVDVYGLAAFGVDENGCSYDGRGWVIVVGWSPPHGSDPWSRSDSVFGDNPKVLATHLAAWHAEIVPGSNPRNIVDMEEFAKAITLSALYVYIYEFGYRGS